MMAATDTPHTAPPLAEAPRYAIGQRVFVRAEWPEALQYLHIRTPSYARGHQGIVTKCFGAFPNPEDLAFGRPAPKTFLYHVAFDRAALWPGDQATLPGRDVLLIELYEHWLEAVPTAHRESTMTKDSEPKGEPRSSI